MSLNRRSQPLLGAAIAIALFASVAQGAPASSSPPPVTNTEDIYFDFEVYRSKDVVVWVVIAYSGNGGVAYYYLDSYAEAVSAANQLESTNWKIVDTEITHYTKMAPWSYLETFDKRVEAEQFAATLEGLGNYAKIERVNGLPSR